MEGAVFRIIEVPDVKDTDTIASIAKNPPASWEEVWKSAAAELEETSEDLEKEEKEHGTFFPRKQDLFRAFELCPLDEVKVVIFGQDPYDRPGLANGLSFSVSRGCTVPPSLTNIYKELERTIEGFRIPRHGDLSPWASQGVLLLNACLTVRQRQPGSHKAVWAGFVRKVVRAICNANPQCIFVLWGREAGKMDTIFHGNVTVLRGPHPAHRQGGFAGCNHFAQINEILEKEGKIPIDWRL